MNGHKKPIRRDHLMVLIWQDNDAVPSLSLSDMRLRQVKVEGHVLSGLCRAELGYRGSTCFEVQVELHKHEWRWRYRFDKDDKIKFSRWFKIGDCRGKERDESHASDEMRGLIAVFDHTKPCQVARMMNKVHSLHDDRGSYSMD